MKKLILTLAVIFVFTNLIFPQFKNPAKTKSKELIERKILYVNNFFENETQREWFKKYWCFEHEIKIVSHEEIEEIVKQKKSNAAILSGLKRNEYKKVGDKYWEIEAFMLAIYLSEDAKKWKRKNVPISKKDEVFKVSFSYKPDSEQDFKFIGHHFYNYLSNAKGVNSNLAFDNIRLKKEITAKLANKTLLIPKEACNLNDHEIKEYYPFPYKLVEYDYIGSAILNNSDKEAYFNILFLDITGIYAMFVISCDDHEILSYIGTGEVSFGTIGLSFSSLLEKKRHLKILKRTQIRKAHLKALKKRVAKSIK